MKRSILPALVFRACALSLGIPGVLTAQDFNAAVEAPADVVFSSSTWKINAPFSHDGVDAAYTDLQFIAPGPWGGASGGSSTLTGKFTTPVRITWWQRFNLGSSFLTGSHRVTMSAPYGQSFSQGFTGWTQYSAELGPGTTVDWRVGGGCGYDCGAPNLTNVASLDEMTFTPLPVTGVGEALDSVGDWVLSAPGAWQGVQSTVASDTADYLWMPAGTPGVDTWVERSFTGPADIRWRWCRNAADPEWRLLVDGVQAMTDGTPGPSWTNATVSIGAGSHTLRWVTSSGAAKPTSAGLDAVVVMGPGVTYADVLDTPGRTWEAGGSPLPVIKVADTGAHLTVVDFAPAAGSTSWLETSVTGPAYAKFWINRISVVPAQPAVLLDGLPFSLFPSGSDFGFPIPPGTHSLRFVFAAAGSLDSVEIQSVAATSAMLLGVPDYFILEKLPATLAPVLAPHAGGGVDVAKGDFTIFPPTLDEPSVFTVNFSGLGGVQMEVPMSDAVLYTGLAGGSKSQLAGGGPVPLRFTAAGTGLTLNSLTRTFPPRVNPGEALDTDLPVRASFTGQVLGLGGGVGSDLAGGTGTDNTDSVWLQSSAAGEAAWLETTVGTDATVTVTFRGTGTVQVNGGTPITIKSNQGWSGSTGSGWLASSWSVPAPGTIRWSTLPGDRYGLFLDGFHPRYSGPVAVDDAIDHPVMATGGDRAWEGWFNAATGDDFARTPPLLPGEEAWVETASNGPLEFDWSVGPGDRMRFYIDGELRADTDLGYGSPVRAQAAGSVLRRFRWVASRSPAASGPSPSPPTLNHVNSYPYFTYLYGLLGGAFGSTATSQQVVFWARGWGSNLTAGHSALPSTPGPQPITVTTTAAFGLYCSGTGTLGFGGETSSATSPNFLHAPGYGFGTIQVLGTTVAGPLAPWKEYRRSITSDRLSSVVIEATVNDVLGTNGATSIATAQLGNIYWLPGNTAWRTWTSARGLTGLAADTTTDPDRDGLSSVVEYLLGTDPLVPNASPVALTGTLPALRLTAPKPPWPITGTALRLDTSPDLLVWDAAPGSLIADTPSSWTWQLPASTSPRTFARLTPVVTPD